MPARGAGLRGRAKRIKVRKEDFLAVGRFASRQPCSAQAALAGKRGKVASLSKTIGKARP